MLTLAQEPGTIVDDEFEYIQVEDGLGTESSKSVVFLDGMEYETTDTELTYADAMHQAPQRGREVAASMAGSSQPAFTMELDTDSEMDI